MKEPIFNFTIINGKLVNVINDEVVARNEWERISTKWANLPKGVIGGLIYKEKDDEYEFIKL